MLSQPQIAKRLRKVRELYGIKEEKVADSLGLSRQDVVCLETGQRPVSACEITKLTEIYRCSTVFLLSEHHELDEDDLPVFFHRELSKLRCTPKIKAALWQLFDLYVEVGVLRETLNQTAKPALPDYSSSRESKPDDSIQQARIEVNESKPERVSKYVAEGKSAAQKERRRLDLGSGPVPNVAGLIREQGIWTAAVKLPAKLRGLFVKHPDVGLVILVNQQDSPAHRRFIYLHEFAHALFDRSDRPVMMPFDFGAARRNAFAEEFLMPQEGIAKKLKQLGRGHPALQKQMDSVSAGNVHNQSIPQAISYHNTVALAHYFGVGYETAVRRLANLKFIDATKEDDLNQKKKDGERDIKRLTRSESSENSESSKISEREPHKSLRHLACEAFHKEQISRGRFIEIGRKINASRHEMFEFLDGMNFNN